MLYDRYYSIGKRGEEGKYLVQTRSQSKSSGITLPAVHGAEKGINPSIQLEKQVTKFIVVATVVKTSTQTKPRIRQGRAGLRRKVKISTHPQPNKPVQMISKPNLHKSEGATQTQITLESVPQTGYTPAMQTRPYPEPVCRLPPRSPDNTQEDRKTSLDLDF